MSEFINPKDRNWQGKDKITGSANADALCTECRTWYNSSERVQVSIHKHRK